jgi:antitoxin (DNA-binding transcriptional repressor) of toxin-antitoxin stability system
MYAVGIRELKAKLSEYIRRARNGEVVLVSDRGRVVAELRAPTVRTDNELALAGLVGRGELIPAAVNDPSVYVPSRVHAKEGAAAEVLDQVRADRLPGKET